MLILSKELGLGRRVEAFSCLNLSRLGWRCLTGSRGSRSFSVRSQWWWQLQKAPASSLMARNPQVCFSPAMILSVREVDTRRSWHWEKEEQFDNPLILPNDWVPGGWILMHWDRSPLSHLQTSPPPHLSFLGTGNGCAFLYSVKEKGENHVREFWKSAKVLLKWLALLWD